jgi:restriction system protein
MVWSGLVVFVFAIVPAKDLSSLLFWLPVALAAIFLLFFPGWLAKRLQQHERNQLLNTRRGLASIRALSWQDFELLVGNAYQRLGYRLTETGGGGADGGVDLILRKDGQKILVQCKRWNSGNVGATVVRERLCCINQWPGRWSRMTA